MKKLKSFCSIFCTVLFVVSAFMINIPNVKAEGDLPGQVQNVQASLYPFAVYLTWDPVPGAELYRIPCNMEPIETTETHAWIRDVRPESEYTFYIQGVNASGDGPLTSITITTPELTSPIPSYISNLEVVSVEQESVQLRFTPVNDAEEFYITWSTDSDFTNYWQYDVQKTEAQDHAYIRLSTGEPEYELPPESTCYFRVWAKNYGPTMDSDPYLTPSNVATAQTGDATALPEGQLIWFTPPDSILGDNEYVAGPDSVTVCVYGGVMPRNLTGAAGYRIYYSTTPDPKAEGVYSEYTMFTSEYALTTVTGLAPLTTYYLQIVPFNHLGEGTPSEILEIATTESEGEAPSQVQNVQAIPYPCAVYLTWAPVEGATSYKIPGMDDIITEDTYAWVHGLSADCECEFQVIACNSYGEGIPSEPITVETLSLPTYPSQIPYAEVLETTSGDLYSTAKIRFEQVNDALNYYVKYDTDIDMSNAGMIYLGCNVNHYWEFDLDVFAPETTYYLQVVGQNFDPQDNFYDTPSYMVVFTTPAPKYPLLEGTTVEIQDEYFDSGADWVFMSWSLLNGASGTEWGNVSKFRLYYAESPDQLGDTYQYVDIPVSGWCRKEYTLTGLDPLTTYYFQVLPYNSLGYGEPSEIKSFSTTEDLRPGQVQNVQATPYSTAVYLTWDPVEGATSYMIPAGMETVTTETNSVWFHSIPSDESQELQIVAINEYGEGVPSEPVTFQTLPLPQYPSKIPYIEIMGISLEEYAMCAEVYLRYEQVPDALQYYVKYSTNPDMSESGNCGLSSWSTHICEARVDVFAPETTYYLQIIAVNYYGMDDWWETPSDIVSFTTPAPIYAPETAVRFRDDYFDSSSDSITVACSPNANEWCNISMLRLYYSETYDELGDGNQHIDIPVSGSYTKTFTLTGLAASTTYYFQVVPFNSFGFGPPSEIASMTTLASDGIETGEGTNIIISDPVSGTSLLFESVVSSGITTVEQLTSQPDDTGFYFEEACGYYDIETTATFNGSVRVTLPYDPTQISGLESDLRLYQFKDGQPVDITESIDTENNTITGIVTDYFYIFAIGIPDYYSITFDTTGVTYAGDMDLVITNASNNVAEECLQTVADNLYPIRLVSGNSYLVTLKADSEVIYSETITVTGDAIVHLFSALFVDTGIPNCTVGIVQNGSWVYTARSVIGTQTYFPVTDNGKDYEVRISKGGMNIRLYGQAYSDIVAPITTLSVNTGLEGCTVGVVANGSWVYSTAAISGSTKAFSVFDIGTKYNYEVRVYKGGMSYIANAVYTDGAYSLEVPVTTLSVNTGLEGCTVGVVANGSWVYSTAAISGSTKAFSVFDIGTKYNYEVRVYKGGMSYIANAIYTDGAYSLDVPVYQIEIPENLICVGLVQNGSWVYQNVSSPGQISVFNNGKTAELRYTKDGVSSKIYFLLDGTEDISSLIS